MCLKQQMWGPRCFSICTEVTVWTLVRNFRLLEVKAETEREEPETGWFGVRDLEEQKEKRREKTESAVEATHLSVLRTVCSAGLTHRLLSSGVPAVSGFPDIAASLQLHTNTGTREGRNGVPNQPPSLIGGKTLLQKPQHTFLICRSYSHF